MMTNPPLDPIQQALHNAATPSPELFAIAQAHPELWAAIAAHPGAEDWLLTYLDQHGDPSVRQVVAWRRQSAAKPKNHGWLIGLLIAVGVVVVALIVGFFIWPSFHGQQPAPATSSAPSAPTTTATSGPTTAAPPTCTGPTDLLNQPSWAALMTLTLPDESTIISIDATGIDCIVIVEWTGPTSGLTGVDLSSGTALWQLTGGAWVGMAGSYGLMSQLPDNTSFASIDVKDGSVISQVTMSDSTDVLASNSDDVIFADSSDNTLCAAATTHLDTCIWKKAVNLDYDSVGKPITFDDGRFINTVNGVLDAATGKQAAFGADTSSSSNKSVYYAGDDSGNVIKITGTNLASANSTFTYQAWNTTTNQPASSVITTTYQQNGDITNFDAWTIIGSTLLTVSRSLDVDGTTLTAYSMADMTSRWSASLPSTCYAGLQPLGPGFYMLTDDGATDCQTSIPNQTIISADTGTQLWSDSSCNALTGPDCTFGGGSQIAYLMINDQLQGVGGTPPDFKTLWTVDSPDVDAFTIWVANQVIAYNQDTWQIWILAS